MSVEYAPLGLVGVLTPQANTTVEPEFAILWPPGIAMLNARMTSTKPSIIARLLDYLRDLPEAAAQFANAPIKALAFACTGASYYAGVAEEDALVASMEDRLGIPVITAARAVLDQPGRTLAFEEKVEVRRREASTDPMLARMPTLLVDLKARTGATDDPVTIDQGSSQLTGTGLDIDLAQESFSLRRDVRAVFNQPARQPRSD